MGGITKFLVKCSVLFFLLITFLYAVPKPGEEPRDFTRYHYHLDCEWNLYDHLDGNTVIFLNTGSFT